MATLKSYIERIENLEEEKKGISDDIASVYKEAKNEGYDPAVMKVVVKRRKMSDAERIAADQILATYEANVEEQFELPIEDRRGNARQAEIATGGVFEQDGQLKQAVRDRIVQAGFEVDPDKPNTFRKTVPETVN